MSHSLPKLTITRRHLPHWSLEGATYFISMRLTTRPLDMEEVSLLRAHFLSGDARYYDLVAASILPDHTHLLLAPRPGYSLSRIMKGLKGVSARWLNQRRGTKGRVWQDESFDRIVRNQNELDEKLKYMYLNPVKEGLTENPEEYVGWYFKGHSVTPKK